ncbi:MAG: ATPase [Rickettsiales bacterium]|nr:MAG: ATPase [Rickettsiales bacterium]
MFFIPSNIKILNNIKKLLPKSLLIRFMLIIMVPTLIAQLLAVYLFYQRHWYNVTRHTSSLVTTEISSLLSENYETTPNKQHSYQNLSYIFIPTAKLPAQQKKYAKELEIFKLSLQQRISQEIVLISKDNGRNYLYLQIGDNVLKIELPYKSLIHPSTRIFVLWIFFLTILLLSVSLIFSRNQINSIINLTNAVESYGIGEKTKIYKPSGASEVRRAGLAFLKMKDRIDRQTAKRTQMLAMISHDLKTPLTRMKLQAEMMENPEEKEELMHDIDSMKHMISSYLDFAHGEGGENFQKIDLNQWVPEYLNQKWSSENISVNLGDIGIFAQIKPHSFERALSNIISNALKYSTKIKISVSLSSEKENAMIIIEDNGKGIKEHERKLVFKPFYRADKSRSLGDLSSVGLGLAITKEIINGHYGTIILDTSIELGGLLVKIKLPIKT